MLTDTNEQINKCTKYNFGWGSDSIVPLGKHTALPQTPWL